MNKVFDAVGEVLILLGAMCRFYIGAFLGMMLIGGQVVDHRKDSLAFARLCLVDAKALAQRVALPEVTKLIGFMETNWVDGDLQSLHRDVRHFEVPLPVFVVQASSGEAANSFGIPEGAAAAVVTSGDGLATVLTIKPNELSSVGRALIFIHEAGHAYSSFYKANNTGHSSAQEELEQYELTIKILTKLGGALYKDLVYEESQRVAAAFAKSKPVPVREEYIQVLDAIYGCKPANKEEARWRLNDLLMAGCFEYYTRQAATPDFKGGERILPVEHAKLRVLRITGRADEDHMEMAGAAAPRWFMEGGTVALPQGTITSLPTGDPKVKKLKISRNLSRGRCSIFFISQFELMDIPVPRHQITALGEALYTSYRYGNYVEEVVFDGNTVSLKLKEGKSWEEFSWRTLKTLALHLKDPPKEKDAKLLEFQEQFYRSRTGYGAPLHLGNVRRK